MAGWLVRCASANRPIARWSDHGISTGPKREFKMAPEEKPRVLIVDDEHVIADTLVTIFSAAGLDAVAVYSAEQALALMPKWHPHIAIVDVHLPGMNGIDLAIRLKAEHPDCRVTLFSGYASTGDLLEKARLDGHSFEVLAKPVHPTELLSLIARKLAPPAHDEIC
jgi:CheY-like chemotaxis protein